MHRTPWDECFGLIHVPLLDRTSFRKVNTWLSINVVGDSRRDGSLRIVKSVLVKVVVALPFKPHEETDSRAKADEELSSVATIALRCFYVFETARLLYRNSLMPPNAIH